MPRFQGDNLRRKLALVEELKAHAAAGNCTPAQLALAWVLSRARYIVAIPGTSHRHRLDENAAAVSLEISVGGLCTRVRSLYMLRLALASFARRVCGSTRGRELG
jgi:aryl-alcohol dehydrogenase-like predicted oxidoreductase